MGISLTHRNIVINADDLGLNPAVNAGIIRLAELGRVSATSYMTGGDISQTDILALRQADVDIGLHLDFTGIFASHLTQSLKKLLMNSYLRNLPAAQINTAICQQLDQFEQKFGQIPVFIDGHQHIHQFPVIRHALMQQLTQRYQGKVMTRNTHPIRFDKKSWLIYQLGGQQWEKQCRQNHIITNDYFGGVYNFDADETALAQLWATWFAHCPPTHATAAHPPISLLMCHPAQPNTGWEDEIKTAREIEYHWLLSEKFAALCQHYQVTICHWRDIPR